jgi:hypothetical protein
LEKKLTSSYFYKAQVFAKIGDIEKGIQYSAKTLQRQLKTGEYQLKDFVINCVTMGDYFTNTGQYAQAEYVLIAVMSLLPEDQTKKVKMRANIQIVLGNLYVCLLEAGCEQLNMRSKIDMVKAN